MKVRWTAAARQDRANIRDYIAEDDPRAAIRMDDLVVVLGIIHTSRQWPPAPM